MSRVICHRYLDPLDVIWLETCRQVGWRVERSDEVFASFDGAGLLTLSTPECFDPDDSLAQLIFHELCHALVAGPEKVSRPDFGLCNESDKTQVDEWACHRLQASLAQRYGLRGFFGVTTDHRAYWDGLPTDPLADPEDDAASMARQALKRADSGPFAGPLHAALEATAKVVALTQPFADADSLYAADSH